MNKLLFERSGSVWIVFSLPVKHFSSCGSTEWEKVVVSIGYIEDVFSREDLARDFIEREDLRNPDRVYACSKKYVVSNIKEEADLAKGELK